MANCGLVDIIITHICWVLLALHYITCLLLVTHAVYVACHFVAGWVVTAYRGLYAPTVIAGITIFAVVVNCGSIIPLTPAASVCWQLIRQLLYHETTWSQHCITNLATLIDVHLYFCMMMSDDTVTITRLSDYVELLMIIDLHMYRCVLITIS